LFQDTPPAVDIARLRLRFAENRARATKGCRNNGSWVTALPAASAWLIRYSMNSLHRPATAIDLVRCRSSTAAHRASISRNRDEAMNLALGEVLFPWLKFGMVI
jgi:hypothetical protein